MAARSSPKSSEGQSDSLYRAVVDTAVDAIVVIDRDGAIRSVNQATERMFGYAPGEMVGHNVNMLMPQPYAGEHDGYLANYLAHRHQEDHRHRPRGGRAAQGRLGLPDGPLGRRGERR